MKEKIVNMLRAAKLPDWEIVGLKRELTEFARLIEVDVEIKYARLANEKLAEVYEAGVVAEREACAKVAEKQRYAMHTSLTSNPVQNGTAIGIANAIRARGDKHD